MTTRLETYNYRTSDWKEFKRLAPGEHTTFSQNVSEGLESLYLVNCAEDNSSTNISIAINPNEKIISTTERVVELHHGEAYEIELKREFTPLPAKVRVTHAKE